MRLEFEPNVAAIPLVENEVTDHLSYPEAHDLDSLLKRGIAAAQTGDRTLARMLLTEASAVDPACETAWMWLASISEYPEELLAFLDRVLDINPVNDKAVEWRQATTALLAKTFVQRAKTAPDENDGVAAQSLDQAERLRLHSTLADAKAAALGWKAKKALELVDEFLRTVPDNAEAWVLRSHLALDIEDKIQSLEEALKIDEYHLTARAMYDFLTTTLRSDTPVEPEMEIPVKVPVEPTVETVPIEVEFKMPGEEPVQIIETAPIVDESGRSIEDIFGSAHEEIDPAGLTVESVTLSTGDLPAIEPKPLAIADSETFDPVNGAACPYCHAGNDPQAFGCMACHAVLTLSDLESLFAEPQADQTIIQQAVTEMEAEWDLREFSVAELTALGLGHFNVKDHDAGLKYLEEASRLAPNDVILSGQVNAIAIRLDEMRRQDEVHAGMPTGRTILVVDDSPTVRKLIAGKLEKSGHSVICAADGIEAMEQLEVVLPDLVLLDITMPRMDGYEVCKLIRANPEARDLPVVMISGKDGFFDKVRGRMAGTTGYVTKPFGPETLMKALETYLAPSAE